MEMLKQYIVEIPDFPRPGILFRDINPLLRRDFAGTLSAIEGLLSEAEWADIDVVAGVESRGFILAAGLAERRRKGFAPVRKQGKLPPPVVHEPYRLEYGTGVLEMQAGQGNLLLIDDVLATGGTLQAAASLSQRSGFRVCSIVVLLDLKLIEQFVWRDISARSAIQY
jgi:adenine phosphoribosyltransferase